jgi:flagellar basal body rod protein FlgC
VAAPNVDLAAEALDVLAASMAFRANLAVLRAAQTTTKHLLDLDA